MEQDREESKKPDNPDNLNRLDESRREHRDRGKDIPGYSGESSDLDRVTNTGAGPTKDALDEEVDYEHIDSEDLDHLKGNIPGRSDSDAGQIERGPESGRGTRGKGSEGGEISGK